MLSIVSLFFISFQLFSMMKGLKQVPELKHSSDGVQNGPLLSVVIAAKDEEENVEKTLTYLSEQDYKNIELIFVNDRSSDKTGELLERFKSKVTNKKGFHYKTIHINELPNGWAGKNHALYQGYLQSNGDYLVFTDADIVFEKDALSKTTAYVHENQVEHMAMMPKIICSQFALKAFIHLFVLAFCMFLQPWKVFIKGKKGRGIGVGAFNLIKRTTYEQIGTHKAFPIHPIDDIELGKRAHAVECNQHFVVGRELLEVEWYPSLRLAIKGFQKNFFASVGYKVSNVFVLSAVKILYGIYPFVGLFLFESWLWYVPVLSILLLLYLHTICVSKFSSLSLGELFIFPITVGCYIYTLFLSMYFVLKSGGVQWRGSFYPLKDLKLMLNKNI